jgi:hypothetical protein
MIGDGIMSKYDALGSYLSKQFGSEIPMSFADIERVTGVKLPPKAQHHRAWWSNNPSNNVVWLAAGFQTEQVDMASRKLVFKRKFSGNVPPPSAPQTPIRLDTNGLADEGREFTAGSKATGTRRQHPLIGSMKGTFTIEPGYDLTRPALGPEDLAEWEANLDRMADMVEQGMSKKQ